MNQMTQGGLNIEPTMTRMLPSHAQMEQTQEVSWQTKKEYLSEIVLKETLLPIGNVMEAMDVSKLQSRTDQLVCRNGSSISRI